MSFAQCQQLAAVLAEFPRTWCIAGGWAIDLFIREETREHQDIEIVIFRKDQLQLKYYLKEWDFQKVIDGEVQPWGDEFLELPVHEIHATNAFNGDRMEVLFNETQHDNWRFRRDVRISCPLDFVCKYFATGVPYLNPAIVLLYKAKHTREKDQHDFLQTHNLLSCEQRQWLRRALQRHEPNHRWLPYLLN